MELHGQRPEWQQVIVVFAAQTAGAEDGVGVFTLDADRVERLRQVFWDMCQLRTEIETVEVAGSDPEDEIYDNHIDHILHIYIESETAETMRMVYDFSKYQNDALDVLMENLSDIFLPTGDLSVSQENASELLSQPPEDLDAERAVIVETALQLVGKVTYFWGGKSQTIGWDSRWGTPMAVFAAGSAKTGTVRPYGLDCSGFVD